MLWRERGEPRGGLLSADLDFDKTSTVLSLVLETKNTRRLNAEGEQNSGKKMTKK